eukprot:12056796-Ditylum_brightwellii.AAC.1
MNNVRVANAKDCYEKLGKELTKTGKEKDIKKMLEYKQTGDKKTRMNMNSSSKQRSCKRHQSNKRNPESLPSARSKEGTT